ncbi:MAG: 4-hydroxythreonine-4-phosphate dehydrogenase PdxA [Deltaproteobacteria bacterium]|nr:4-hydroxythreonine-4-phosphate dehydrogenase PdxA [Deltaproteobacteria bacterium]
MKPRMKPAIAITMGDPAGVGPEIVMRALGSRKVRRVCAPLVVGDERLLYYLAQRLGLPPPCRTDIISLSNLDPRGIRPAAPGKEGGRAMIAYVEHAVAMAADGRVAAIVTAPINKETAARYGFKFPGHTEFIAHLTGTSDFRMMLGGRDLKVVLATIHEPIKKVPGLLTVEKVFKTIKITHDSFKRYFTAKRPRIAVCGLNPHAGEGGLFGKEEKTVIGPAIKKARSMRIDAQGPLPPDTTFFQAVREKKFDCVVCMYHDQGLIPLKLLHFEDGVNVTLGLPIIRTSPDHGTAYDIAWKGVASPLSLIAAIETAAEMARKRGRVF